MRLKFATATRSARRTLLLTGVLCTMPLAAGTDSPLPEPKGPVVLTITGHIANTNADGMARFDIPMLESLPHSRLETETPWDSHVTQFDGVSMRALLDAVGAPSAVKIQASALNEYNATLSDKSVRQYDPIIAYKKDGHYMRIRERGPLMIIFPYDQFNLHKNEFVQHQSVWQLNHLHVE